MNDDIHLVCDKCGELKYACACASAVNVYPWNPKHRVGTCGQCGKELALNVPRLGRTGGFVHKDTCKFLCQSNGGTE